MFGDRLKLARKKAGLSLQALAGQVSPPITAQAISKYEAGRMMPSSAVLAGLGKALGVSLDFLMSGHVAALSGVEFRKHSATSSKDRAHAAAIVIEKLEDYLAIEDILELNPPADPFGALRADGVSYIFAGKTEIDLAGALETLKRELGIERIMLEGGGGANGALLRAGLIDELSLVICPVIDGSTGGPVVFNSGDVDLGPAPIESMTLASHEVLDGGTMWLRYRLQAKTSP